MSKECAIKECGDKATNLAQRLYQLHNTYRMDHYDEPKCIILSLDQAITLRSLSCRFQRVCDLIITDLENMEFMGVKVFVKDECIDITASESDPED